MRSEGFPFVRGVWGVSCVHRRWVFRPPPFANITPSRAADCCRPLEGGNSVPMGCLQKVCLGGVAGVRIMPQVQHFVDSAFLEIALSSGRGNGFDMFVLHWICDGLDCVCCMFSVRGSMSCAFGSAS